MHMIKSFFKLFYVIIKMILISLDFFGVGFFRLEFFVHQKLEEGSRKRYVEFTSNLKVAI